MSRMCWREASSGTTPPHSRWMATCEATTFERIAQGFAASPVSSTTAADVSSQDVSIPRINMSLDGGGSECRLQRFGVRRAEHAALGDDAGNQLVRRHVEGGVPDMGTVRRQLTATQVRDLAAVALFDGNLRAVGGTEIDSRQRGRHIKGNAVLF